MTYIWIDLWDKRVGVAIEREGISFPFSIIPRTKIMDEIKKITKEKSVTAIVVWLPYDLYGIKTKQLEKTKNFIEKLKNLFPDIEVIGVDERFSTFEAEEVNNKLWLGKKEKDDIAACVILDSYLQSYK